MAPFDLVFIYQSRFPLVPALAMLAPFVFANILVSRLPLSLLFSVTIAFHSVCSAAESSQLILIAVLFWFVLIARWERICASLIFAKAYPIVLLMLIRLDVLGKWYGIFSNLRSVFVEGILVVVTFLSEDRCVLKGVFLTRPILVGAAAFPITAKELV